MLAIVLLAAMLECAPAALAQSDRVTKTLTDADGVRVPYQLYLPLNYDKSKKYPLVLCLHGAGEMKSAEYEAKVAASTRLLQPDARAKYPCFLLIPQTTTGWVKRPGRDLVAAGGYRISDVEEGPAMKLVLKALDDVMREYKVDRDRVYVSGQSMGGVATWDLIVRHSELFAAAVPICGVGDTSSAGKIRCPVWCFHGDDDKTVPVKCSREMVEAMKAAGGTVKYTELPGVGHGSWGPAWQTDGLIDWMFAQRRKSK
jgi:predicted peptidase